MKNVDLTFGIPVYNGEKYISDLLKCFDVEENEISYEILIVDDGSIDNTYNICRNFNNKHLRLVKKVNGGVSSARNKIIRESKGKYITFIDADDTIDFKKYIEVFKKNLENGFEMYINVPNIKFAKYVTDPKNIKKIIIEKEIINSPCMKFYNLEIIRNNNILFDESIDLGEDLVFNLDYLNKVNKIGFFYDNIYKYRIVNENSLTHKYRKNKFDTLMLVYSKCIERSGKDLYSSFEFIRIKNNFSVLKTEMMFNYNLKNNLLLILKMKKFKSIQLVFPFFIKNMCMYYLWYLTPSIIIFLLFKIVLGGRINEKTKN